MIRNLSTFLLRKDINLFNTTRNTKMTELDKSTIHAKDMLFMP